MKRHAIFVFVVLFSLPIAAMQKEPFSMRVVATGLSQPWEITWGPDGNIWTTERVGKRVTRVNPADGSKSTALTIAEVFQSHGQDGLLGMALHSGLSRGTGNDFVYTAYTYDSDPGTSVARRGKIRRYTYNTGTQTLDDPVDLISSLPAGEDHVGFRLAFGPDQKLYLTIGDQGANWLQNFCVPNRAQELPTSEEVTNRDWTKYQGKILRLNLDGTIPSDNPLLAGVRSHIFSYGHRNPQGLAFGNEGRLYASEHGPEVDDELNLIESGKNYGWPFIAGYKDERLYVFSNWAESRPAPCASLKFDPVAVPASVPRQPENAWSHPDFRPAIKTFFTVANGYDVRAQGSATIAPGGMDIYTGSAVPGWTDSLLLLSLKLGKIYRVKLDSRGAVVGEATEHFKTTNRYRDIAIQPDQRVIYLATDNSGNSTDDSGKTTRSLENPGAILAFRYGN